MKLSVNKAQLAGLWAWNCATIQQVWILKFALGPETFPGLPRNGPQELTVSCILSSSLQVEALEFAAFLVRV